VSLPRFLVVESALNGEQAVLTGDELRHVHVRRLHVGRKAILFDGAGRAREATLRAIDRRQAVFTLGGERDLGNEPSLPLTLALAALKADKLDLVIEKVTELGVDRILIFTSERTVRIPGQGRHERWIRLARSAAKQSQRVRVPEVHGPLPFTQVVARRTEPCRLLFWEEATAPVSLLSDRAVPTGGILAVVGPEGGFSAAEAAQAEKNGFELVRLGRRPLRAETAAIVAVGLCQLFWGELRPT
jgi:16S rRNA (uracil1498-N3)-methyltransferase